LSKIAEILPSDRLKLTGYDDKELRSYPQIDGSELAELLQSAWFIWTDGQGQLAIITLGWVHMDR